MFCQACCLVKLLPRRPLLHLTPDPLDLFRYSGKNLLPNGSGLKFYNLHQTLNISINVLKSFTDIYCISSARSGFVFFISFTSFFLTLICPHHILSGMSCQACCLVLVAWRCSAKSSQLLLWLVYQEPWSRYNPVNFILGLHTG